jgi:hypothetical protein
MNSRFLPFEGLHKPAGQSTSSQTCQQLKNGNKAIFLAIDMFTGFVLLSPLKSQKTKDLIQAFTLAILNPFKIPEVVRCDNENGMANSQVF